LAWVYEPSPNLPTVIWADEKRLRQVLIHLLSNAVKFTHQGTIRFQVQTEGKEGSRFRLRFQVEDTGIGIATEHLDRIFLPFEQLSDWKQKSEGAGLGLSLAKQWVELMDGRIQVESQLGKGSKFWVILDFPETLVCHSPVVQTPSPDFSTLSMTALSATQAAELFDLAMIGDLSGILELITKLEQEHAELQPFTDKIRQLVLQFDDVSICQMVQPYMENRE
jgi:hypothetical protein